MATTNSVPHLALRAWQRAALSEYFAAPGTDFQLTATPGAGKTTFALVIADRLLKENVIEQIVVVAPTDHLRHQWTRSAAQLGLTLDGNLANSNATLRKGFLGYVTTYAQVAMMAGRHLARVTARPTLVILDEIHHAGDGLTWGDAIQLAFGDATRRLSLSGTPFRTKPGERIPFIEYTESGDELTSVADFTYSYADALADGVVRPVLFAAYSGESRWLDQDGREKSAVLGTDPDQTKQDNERAWRTALDPGGHWVPHVIAAMHDRVTAQRQNGTPDAAGLVLASDQDSARAYARIVKSVTGQQPVLVLSDDPTASAKIERFRDSPDMYAVCVRMISEGCDIPRATAVAYLTNYQTPLFFTQAVGRVVRARSEHEIATVFLPAVPSLLALAAEIEQQRNHVIKLHDDALVAESDIDLREVGEPVADWTPLSAQARFAHVVQSGRAVLAEDTPAEDDDFLGLPGLLTPEQNAVILSRRDEELRKAAKRDSRARNSTIDTPTIPDVVAGDTKQLRRDVSAAVGAVAAASGESHQSVHVWLRQQVAGPPSAAADEAVLKLRLDALRSRLVRTSRIAANE